MMYIKFIQKKIKTDLSNIQSILMNILLVAEESAGIHALRVIKKSGHTLKGVLTQSEPSGKGVTVASVAHQLGYNVLPAKLVKDPVFTKWLIAQEIDVLLNVHSLYVICTEVIKAVRFGAFNLHPGPLPAYAGLNAPSWAIYNEEKNHGVTLHRISDSIDAGEIIFDTSIPVSPSDTGLTLSAKCVKHGILLIEKFLNQLHNPDSIKGRSQNLSQRTYYGAHNIPNRGRIDWTNSAHKIDAFIRACRYSPFPSPWGEPKTSLGDFEISILSLEISDQLSTHTPGRIGEPVHGKASVSTADFRVLIDECFIDKKPVQAISILKSGNLLK